MKYWILVSVVIMSSSAIPSPWNNYPGFGSDHHHYGHQQQHNCDSSSEEWSDSDFGSDTQPWKDSSGSWGSGNWKDWVWPNHNKHPWHSWSGTTNPPQTKPPIPTTKPTTKRPSTWSTSKPRPPSTNLPPKKPSNSTTTTTRSPILQVTPSSSLGACMTGCPVTSEYNPVCGSNGITYNNIGRLDCAKSCGVAVEVVRESRCPTDGVIQIPITNATPIPTVPPTRYTSILETSSTTAPNNKSTIPQAILDMIFTTDEPDYTGLIDERREKK